MTQEYGIDVEVPSTRLFAAVRRHRALQRKPASDRAGWSAMPSCFFGGSAWRRGRARVGFARLEPRQDGVGDIHAGDRARARQASGEDRAADEIAHDGRHRKEEADRDAGEAGQDKQDSFRSDIGDAAADLRGSQASVPKQNEGGDCGGDPNGQAPPRFDLSTRFRTNARRRRSKRGFAPHSVGGLDNRHRAKVKTQSEDGRRRRGPAARRLFTLHCQLVLRLRLKITGVMALMQLP
jgi:rRNA maturation protein Nop10